MSSKRLVNQKTLDFDLSDRSGGRPDIYSYHDISTYLTAWFEHLQSNDADISLRKFADQLSMSPSHFSMILKGQRALTDAALRKMKLALDLNEDEIKFLKVLREIRVGISADERAIAFEKLQKHKAYRSKNPGETATFRLLTSWVAIAIKEISQLKGFILDSNWISRKLAFKAGSNEINKSIKLLFDSGLLRRESDGSISAPHKTIQCHDQVFAGAMTEYHKMMMDLAKESIETVPRDERHIVGQTATIPAEKFHLVQEAIDECKAKIAKLEEVPSEGAKKVIQVELAAFPLTKKVGSHDQ